MRRAEPSEMLLPWLQTLKQAFIYKFVKHLKFIGAMFKHVNHVLKRSASISVPGRKKPSPGLSIIKAPPRDDAYLLGFNVGPGLYHKAMASSQPKVDRKRQIRGVSKVYA